MNTRKGTQNSSKIWAGKCLAAIFIFSLLLAGCSPAAPAPISTQPIVPSAISATATVKPTELPPQPSSTSTVTATPIPTQTAKPTSTNTPEPSPTPTLPPIALTDWKKWNFIEIPAGCLFPDISCYTTIASRTSRDSLSAIPNGSNGKAYNRQGPQSGQASLSSRASFSIHPNWKNPHLVYWYDDQINGKIIITAKVDSGSQIGKWDTLAQESFSGQSAMTMHWMSRAIDLSRYRGQKILISFNAEMILPRAQRPAQAKGNNWHLQNILIIPDYYNGFEHELSAAAQGIQKLEVIDPSQPIALNDWGVAYLSPIWGSCKYPNLVCWQFSNNNILDSIGSGVYTKGRIFTESNSKIHTALYSDMYIYIDPIWNNPYVTFWYDNPVAGDLFVMIKMDGKWVSLAQIPITAQGPGFWKEAQVDLSQSKGKPILINIFADLPVPDQSNSSFTAASETLWHIQNIQLIPNYSATP